MNNKFKRFNKILMMTVAILLCFVLISTSVVSGIFAKYVITKSAGATVSLKKFGLKLSIEKGASFDTSMTMTPDVDTDTDAVSVEITGIGMVPNLTLDEVVRFKIEVASGQTVSVNTKIKVSAKVNTLSNLQSASGSSSYYLPVGFLAKKNGGTSTTIAAAWQTNSTVAKLQTTINNSLKTGLGTFLGTGYTTDGDFACIDLATAGTSKTESLAIRTIGFGFTCPANSTVDDSDKIVTYIAEKGGTFKVIFTVSLEQIIPSNAS